MEDSYNEVGVEFNPSDLDRVHRIGKKKYDFRKKKYFQSIIIKFRNWEARKKFYYARPKFVRAQEGSMEKPPQRKFTVSVDLTRQRLKLLNYARAKIAEERAIKFAFVDINCSLGLRYNDGSLKFFNSKQSLHELLGIEDDDQPWTLLLNDGDDE